jgi:hypothetical protein
VPMSFIRSGFAACKEAGDYITALHHDFDWRRRDDRRLVVRAARE